MTSSLPDFSSSSSAPAASDTNSLAGFFAAPGTATGPTSGAPREFDSLMGTTPGPASVPEQPAGIVSCASTSTRLLAGSGPANPPVVTGITIDLAPSASAATVSSIESVSDLAALEGAAEPVPPREITRDMLEQAATFVTSLLQTLLPEVQLPEFSAVAYQRGLESAGAAGNPAALPSVPAQDATASGETPAAPAANVPRLFTLAADGAIELKLDLAQFQPVEFQQEVPPDQTLVINAELQEPGAITVRLEAAALVPGAEAGLAPQTGAGGRAIFAAKYPSLKIAADLPEQSGERNFVFTGDKQVKSQSPLAGISVAKTETTMPVAPIEEPRFTRNPEPFSVLPQRAEFQVVVPPAERITDPAAAPAGQNFAERAVETVTNLVDTQFSASMQKAGSVQLRLRFGGEDLSVRVELRDGAVHTDFRTDSSELRSALTREWEAVAAQSPEQMSRYLEPVFSPNPPSAPTSGDSPFSFARHQQQPQQDLPSRQPRDAGTDTATFTRRSLLGGPFSPEPAAPRGPAFLPTSQRLSVLA